MTDTKQLMEYAQHPELALQNLAELLALLDSEDESIQIQSNDALENCGVPRSSDVPFLCQQLKSGSSSCVYWACTLLGRLGNESTAAKTIQSDLCVVIQDESLGLSARERAAWAAGELGAVDVPFRKCIEPIISNAPPRLKRLLEKLVKP